jgi:hypothetical protein
MNSKLLRLFPILMFSLLALCVFSMAKAVAQGTVLFDNYIPANVISHVYMPIPTSPGQVQIGNGTADFPVGPTDWTGWIPVSGSGFSAQLFGATGAGMPVDSLAPAFPITAFRTGIAAGFVVPKIVFLSSVPPEPAVATIQMRVWDNHGGTVTDWAMALAQPAGTERLGVSAPIDVTQIAGGGPGVLPPVLVGLQSFNLTYVPEPSPLALAGSGALRIWFAWWRMRARWRSNRLE